jgi:hypothetical protein
MRSHDGLAEWALEQASTQEQMEHHIKRLRDDALMIHDYPEQAIAFIEEEIREIQVLLARDSD